MVESLAFEFGLLPRFSQRKPANAGDANKVLGWKEGPSGAPIPLCGEARSGTQGIGGKQRNPRKRVIEARLDHRVAGGVFRPSYASNGRSAG